MGCDIHLFKEKFVGGKWVAADEWVPYSYGNEDAGIEVPYEKRFTERNYNLFGALSKGVRAEYPFSFLPRGLPLNACDEVKGDFERWGSDAHSASYLYLHELKDFSAWMADNTIPVSGMKDPKELEQLRESIRSGNPDWNLLFPYCGWTSRKDYVEFQIDAPVSFMLGGAVERIISGFDGVDGENHRIVFWFDN